MEYIVTFLSQQKLDDAFAQSMAAALRAQGLDVTNQTKKTASMLELQVDGGQRTEDELYALLSTVHHAPSTDFIIQPHPKPHYKLLISDMDSTMITCECIDELADFVGKKAAVSRITERAMNGELDFEAALTERVALLAGLDEAVLQSCFDERVTPMPGAKELLQAHKHNGGTSVLVSGGFTFFTERVAALLGFDAHYGNRLEILPPHAGGDKEGGRFPPPAPPASGRGERKLTGKVIEPILGKEAKLATLHSYCKKLKITPDEVLAIGDGANDLPMLQAAGLGIAYRAKPAVRAGAKACINHGDLSNIIPLLN